MVVDRNLWLVNLEAIAEVNIFYNGELRIAQLNCNSFHAPPFNQSAFEAIYQFMANLLPGPYETNCDCNH